MNKSLGTYMEVFLDLKTWQEKKREQQW